MNQRERDGADELVGLVPAFKVLGHPIRARIVAFLLDGERCVCEMTGPLDQSQPLVSHHLALLRDAGFLHMRSEGTRTYYSLDRRRFEEAAQALTAAMARLNRATGTNEVADVCARLERFGDVGSATTKQEGNP